MISGLKLNKYSTNDKENASSKTVWKTVLSSLQARSLLIRLVEHQPDECLTPIFSDKCHESFFVYCPQEPLLGVNDVQDFHDDLISSVTLRITFHVIANDCTTFLYYPSPDSLFDRLRSTFVARTNGCMYY